MNFHRHELEINLYGMYFLSFLFRRTEIDNQLSHICIGRNILQGLIVGSGVNWAEDEDLKELVISLGQPVKL